MSEASCAGSLIGAPGSAQNKLPLTRAKGKIVQFRLWRELAVAARFGLVGLTATAVHVLVIWVLLSRTAVPALAANTVAFLTAFGVSFTGNYFWTFRSPGQIRKTLPRFVLISVSVFGVNTLLLAGLLRAGWLPPTEAAIACVPVVAAMTFLASRFWGFRGPSHSHPTKRQPDTLLE